MADNTNIVVAPVESEKPKPIEINESETKSKEDKSEEDTHHQAEVTETPKELDIESEKPESEYESAEEEELQKQNPEIKMSSSNAEVMEKATEEVPVAVIPEHKAEPVNKEESVASEPKPSGDTNQNEAKNLETDLPKSPECVETDPAEIVVPQLTENEVESIATTQIDTNSSKLIEKQETSTKTEPSTEGVAQVPDVTSTVEELDKLLINEKPIEGNVNNDEKSVEKPLDLTTSDGDKKVELSNSSDVVNSNINVKSEKVHINEDAKEDAELNEFLDDLQLSGELQGDLLDEEGHEGGMEQRADLEDGFSDDVDLPLETAVTIDFAVKIEDDSYEDETPRVQNDDKNYVADEEDYDEEDENLADEEGEEYVEGEREQGDGEESVSPTPNKEKVLDDDEDRRNPQYIPKKGAFYEHDDRLTSDQEQAEEEKETEAEVEKQDGKKKKLWLDDGRWNHDMFNKDEQAPKSRDELLNSYGYDIRSEDCPPRARRRRRYGRGPNKYTRNWKDEDAYHKGGSESGHESEGDGRKGNFRQPNQRGRRNTRGGGGSGGSGGYRGRGKMNNRRRQNSDNLSEEEQEPYDQETNSNEGIDNKNNNEPPKMLDKDFPPLVPSSTVEEKEIKSLDNNLINVRGTKAPFPPAPSKPSNVEKFEKSPEKPQSVRTITFENSRYNSNNNHRNSAESKPIPREEERVDPRNFDRGPPRIGRGRGRGRETREQYNAMKNKNDGYHQRPAGRGYTPDKFRNDRPFKSNNYNHRNQFDNAPPPRPKSREEVIDDIMKDLPPINIKEDALMPHNLKSHTENRPKRYSSLRQRGAQEGNFPPPTGGNNFRQNPPPPRHSQSQQNYYDKQNNYKAAPVYPDRMSAASNNANVNHSSPVNPMITGAPIYSTYNTPYQEPFAMRASLNNAPRMYPPPPPAQPVALTPPYLTQAPQTSPALINYVPGPNHPPPPAMLPPPSALHQFPYQQYNGPQPTSSPPIVTPATAMGATVVVSQPQEVYRGGVTYYNTQSQQLLPMRMPPQRRAKSAIPIVDPTQESIAHMQMMSQGSYPGDSYGMLAEEMTTDGTLTSSNIMPVET